MGNYNITAAAALKSLREEYKADALMTAFIDDLAAVVAPTHVVAFFDGTVKALRDGMGGTLNMDKIWVLFPDDQGTAHEEAELDGIRTALVRRGVKADKIISWRTPEKERGVKLLGAPIGHDAYGAELIYKAVVKLAAEAKLVANMGLTHPLEALKLTTASLSKRLDYKARQSDPNSGVLDALGTADMQQHAVLAQIAGEQAQPGQQPKLPPFATAVASLSTVHGGVGLRPLRRLAGAGIPHMASLTQSLPRLLDRLQKPGSGALALAVAAEIQQADTSMLPWAISARAAHARLQQAVGTPMPAASRANLAKLLPSMKEPGKEVKVPSLRELVTTTARALQREASLALWLREFERAFTTAGPYQKFLLRSGSAPGATAHLAPVNLNPFAPSHLAGLDRMQPHVYRMSLRYIMGMEPLPGTAAAIIAGGGTCPSCKTCLVGYDIEFLTNHLMSCAVGGCTQRTALAITQAVQRCMTDVGITSVRELRGLSATSAHRPGDAVSEPVPVPVAYDAGGELRWVVDTTVSYLSSSNYVSAVHGDAEAEVTKAEKDKEAAMRREIATGQRSALPPGFRFVPAAMDARGRKGPQLKALLASLAEHGAAHALATPASTEEGGDAAKGQLAVRFSARMAVALHRALMQAYLYRAQEVARAAEERTGFAAVTGLELRFQQ